MKKAYKIASLFWGIAFCNIQLIAQEIIVPPKAPLAPKPFCNEKQLEEWSKNIEKSVENIGIASVDFSKNLKELRSINIKLPELSELPKLPEIPELAIGNILNYNQNWQPGAPEGTLLKTKKISKTYTTSISDVLNIENSFGKIEINTWNKNEIRVDVEVRAYAGSEDDSKRLLENVSIYNTKTIDKIIFKTIINNQNKDNNWFTMSFWSGGSGEKEKVEIYYTVFMPTKNALNLKTNYTNVVLPSLQGNVSLNMNYGDINAGYLSAKSNIKSNYTQLTFEGLNDAVFSSNYGEIEIGQTKNINANLNYCKVDLGKLSGTANLKMNYSDFRISFFDTDFKLLNINANYSSINLSFNKNNNNLAFNFDVSTTYSNYFKYNDEQVTITSRSPDDDTKYASSKNFKGFYGKSPSANVIIRSNYGGVKFN